MEITQDHIIARYATYNDSLRDARYWFENSNIVQLGNKSPKEIMKEENGAVKLCQWIFLWGQGKL